VKREAVSIDFNTHQTTYIMVDIQNASTIMPYLNRDGVDSEFKDIRSILKENLRNKDKYRRADFSDQARNVFEMRFTRNARNDRIYCQEITFSGKRFIVMVELLLFKKSQKIPKPTRSRIKTIGGYEYELLF